MAVIRFPNKLGGKPKRPEWWVHHVPTVLALLGRLPTEPEKPA